MKPDQILPSVVALFTSDTVMGLDIKQSLESIGFTVWDGQGRDLDDADEEDPPRLHAAIVDMQSPEVGSKRWMNWMAARNIPTIILSGYDHMMSDFSDVPSVVACFAKPLWVDSMLPTVVLAAHAQVKQAT